MKRSGSGSEDEPDVSAEVYLSMRHDGRKGGPIGRRQVALAAGILALATVLVLGRLAAGRTHSSVVPASASSCVSAQGYGGLGGRLRAFDANNNASVGPAEPTPGTAFYVVTGTASGCVTAFAVQESSTPPVPARDLLVLVSHPYLPADARQLVNTDRCAVWTSATLKRATGRAYARATAFSQADNPVGRAQIEVTSNSTC